jgi:hypothetical protein
MSCAKVTAAVETAATLARRYVILFREAMPKPQVVKFGRTLATRASGKRQKLGSLCHIWVILKFLSQVIQLLVTKWPFRVRDLASMIDPGQIKQGSGNS